MKEINLHEQEFYVLCISSANIIPVMIPDFIFKGCTYLFIVKGFISNEAPLKPPGKI